MCGIWGIYSKDNYDKISSFLSSEIISKRGPERTSIIYDDNFFVSFSRLAIQGLSISKDQPYKYSFGEDEYMVICNGEIYNIEELRKRYKISIDIKCDIEVIFEVYKKCNMNFQKLNKRLNGEYALVIIKYNNTKIIDIYFSTDTSSVRPLFLLKTENYIIWSSLLIGITSYIKDKEITKYDIIRIKPSYLYTYNVNKNSLISECYMKNNIEKLYFNIDVYRKIVKEKFITSIKKRLSSDRPIGCLLSGGLDSSLVASIASKILLKENKRLKTYSIGMKNSPDLYYAKKVAEFIDSDHNEIIIDENEALSYIEETIKNIESYDITSIRASIPQYILCKWIKKNTNIKVLLIGDGSDELFGSYKYFSLAPSIEEAEKDRNRILDDIYLFDGLRADRCISNNGLEARLPFLDKEFVSVCKRLPYELLSTNDNSKTIYIKESKIDIEDELCVYDTKKIEKWFIRSCFEGYLPSELLWRSKVAFSDGITSIENSWYSIIKKYCESKEYNINYSECYGDISEEAKYYKSVWTSIFDNRFSRVIPYYWLPRWSNSKDPSARTLENYKE